jgi:hypothetical protein
VPCPRAQGPLYGRRAVLALESEGAGLDFHARSSRETILGSTLPALTAAQTLAERRTHPKVDVRFSPISRLAREWRPDRRYFGG